MSTTFRLPKERIIMIRVAGSDAICVNCKHFYRHYVRDNLFSKTGYMPINMGHCVHPRVKDRHVLDSCKNFEAMQEDDKGLWRNG